MHKTKFALLVLAISGSVFAGVAQEGTQIANKIQLVLSYSKQVQQYQTAMQQYNTMLQNLRANPAGVSLADYQRLANNQAQLIAMGRNIGGEAGDLSKEFEQSFKTPVGSTYSEKYREWNSLSEYNLRNAMLVAGVQRDQMKNDEQNLMVLTEKVRNSDGNVAALQALGNLNAAQLQDSMKLRQLLSEQQISMNTHLAAVAAREQTRTESGHVVIEPTDWRKKSYQSPTLK